MLPDRLSPQLRAVEREIDSHYITNPLIQKPFSHGAWYFLAFCEELMMRDLITEQTDSAHEYHALTENLIVHAQWPLRWLSKSCPPGTGVPRPQDEAMYSAAWELSELGMKFMNFAAAFTLATYGRIELSLDGTTINSQGVMRRDTRFEAYDHLVRDFSADSLLPLIDPAFAARIRSSVRVHGEWFDYELNPRVMQLGVEAIGAALDSRFALPPEWRFSKFTLDDLRRVTNVLTIMALAHFQARVTAAENGCHGLGVARALIVMDQGELVRRLRRYSGVSEPKVDEVVRLFIYGEHRQITPDPALQPIVPLTSSVLAMAPNMILNSSIERNVSVLLNRLPEEKRLYSELSRHRESISRSQFIQELSGLEIRLWYGNVAEWGNASDIDLVIISDLQRQCLVLELKSFIAPAEPREVEERGEEISKGVRQIEARKTKFGLLPSPFRSRAQIDETYALTWAVASETSIGPAHVQSEEIPIVNLAHLRNRIRRTADLRASCEWLRNRDYLPVRGQHYHEIPLRERIGEWTLDWYGIQCVTNGYVEG